LKLHNTTLKNALSLTAIATCATLSTAAAAAELNDDAATPQRTTADSAVSVEQTLGQLVAKQQSEALQYQKLVAVLGDSFVTLAKQYLGDTANLETLWNTTFAPNTPYDAASKRQIIPKIATLITRYSGEETFEYLKLSNIVLKLQSAIKGVPLSRIEESARGYFESVFPGSTVTTSWKRGGDQLGCVAEVTLSGGQVLTYYVKTHSGGLRSDHSSAAKLVNPAELLVYKVLEELGVGCQSHFFGRDAQNLYIATLRAGVQTNPDGTFTQVPFHEYSHFKDSPKPEVQEQLWGKLSHLPTDVEFSPIQHQQAEELENAEDGIARNFVHEVAKLDLLARIMRLTDFQTNPGNYGFIYRVDGRMQAKAIDFRLNSTDPNEVRLGEYFFKGFLNGNGCFDYSSTGKAMYYALRKRQTHLRVHEAKTIITEELQQFERVVDAALQHVSGTLTQVQMTTDDQASRQKELRQYAEIIKSNFGLFREKLESWRPVTTNAE
jgi:hypothetical protein